MKILFVVLFAFLYAAQGVPSRGGTHDSPTHSVKNDLSDETFIQEIRDDSLQTYGEYGADPQIETVGYNHEHTYEDFSADIGRYPEYEQFRSFEGFEDVIPRDVRVSGLSFEDQQAITYPNPDHSDTTEDKRSTSGKLQDAEQDSEHLSASDGFGEDLDMPGQEFEDVTVEGMSDYSYLVGDKLHGINELRAAGVMNGPHKVMFDAGDEEFKDFDYDVEKDEDLNYDEFLKEEDREVQDQEYDHEYDHADEITTRGQGVEDEDNEEFEEYDFEEDDSEEDDSEEEDELDGSERFEDDDYDEDSDAYVEDVDEDDEIDAGVGTTYPDDDGEYDEDEDELGEDNEEDFAARNEEEIQTEARVKGMSIGVSEDDEDEEFDDEDEEDDDEYEDNLPDNTGLLDDEEEEEDEDEYASEMDDEDEDEDDGVWDEEDDDFDTTSHDVELDEGVPEVDEGEASESLHGDDIMSDIKTEKRK